MTTVPIDRELLAEVLEIAEDSIERRQMRSQLPLEEIEQLMLDKDNATLFKTRSLVGEPEPTFDPDEKETGEVKHTTDLDHLLRAQQANPVITGDPNAAPLQRT